MKRGVELRLNTRLEAATGEEAVLVGVRTDSDQDACLHRSQLPHPLMGGAGPAKRPR